MKAGSFRLLPAPPDVIFLRAVAEGAAEGAREVRPVRLAGEITAAGATADIVGLIAQAGWVGELMVLDADNSRSLFFDGGSVVGAQTNVRGERIGPLLHRLGLLDESQLKAIAAALGGGRRFGEVAVQMGLVTREQLFQAIGQQTKEIAFAMLQAAEGMFYFLDRYDSRRVASAHRFSATSLLMESLQRMDETSYFRERIPSSEHVPLAVGGRGEPPPELTTVWRACDGQRSVREVARRCALPEFEVLRALCQLLQTGFVRINAPGPRGAAALVSVFNEAMQTIYRFADGAHGTSVVREHLSGFTSSIGVYAALFAGAGPGPDGRFDAAQLAANAKTLGGGEDPDALLAQRLYPYVAYALFATGSLLSKEDERLLGEQVGPLIRTLAPSPEST